MAEQPPSIEEVLLPGEEVEWAGKRRTDFVYSYLKGLAFVVFLFEIISFLISLSRTLFDDPSFFLTLLPMQLVGILFCIVALYIYLRNVRWYPPWYFITSKRILETRGTRIVKEVDRSTFGEISLHENISIRLDHHANERGSAPVNDITFHDPETSEPLILFDDIWFVYTVDYELFYNMLECPSCGVKISEKLKKCLACGQPLV